jgi:hypothetical protein
MGKTHKPEKLDFSMKAPKGWKSTLQEKQDQRVARRERLNEYFNKIVTDRF